MAADENNVGSFSLNLEGETTGTQWFGQFKAKKKLSLRDQLNRDKIRRELLGTIGGESDPRALSIAYVLSELGVRITEAPPWWKEQANGLDMEDGNVVTKIYETALDIETNALAERKAKADAAKVDLKKDQAEVAVEK